MANEALLAPPTEEELQSAVLAPPKPEEVQQAKQFSLMAPPSPEEIQSAELTASQINLDENVSGHRSEKVGQHFKEDVGTLGAAASSATAAKEFYQKENGWLENTFYALTIPEQFMARQAINVLENAGAMSTEEARELISRDQVHGSDLVNFYWRDPESWYGKGGRFVVGMAADILIDPLSYVGVGALTKLGKTATVGGKAIEGLGKMSKGERAYYKTLEAVEKVIQADGSFAKAGMTAEETAKQNAMAIARAADMNLQSPDAIMTGLAQLEGQLMTSPNAAAELTKQIASGMTEKSFAKEWYEGSRGLTLGARIPFTDVALEVDMPGAISKMSSLPVVALDGMFDFGRTAVRSTGWGDAAYNLVSQIGTNTGKILFDMQQNVRLGSQTALKEEMGQFGKEARRLLQSKQQTMGDRFPQLLEDIVSEMENPRFTLDEATDLAQQFGKTEDDALKLVRRGESLENTERLARLQEHPEIMNMVDDMREMMRSSAREYKARGLPFEELNPFGEGWATGYLKHVVTDNYLRKMREVSEAGDIIEQSMKLMPELAGRADPSALGRSYRGTIKEANEAAQKKFGQEVKMFVDDPIELITMRKMEMQKVIADHDLMQSAAAYAVRKDEIITRLAHAEEQLNAGLITPEEFAAIKKSESLENYVKFSPKEFSRLTNKNTAENGPWNQTFDALVPAEFKGPESLYLPHDVYDRLNFTINGWNHSKPMAKLINAADFYTRVWRNNALFGASYIGLNAFSNALTYLSFNDRGGPLALAKATAMLTPMAKSVMINTAEGKYTAEAVMQLAHEYNLLGSSFAKGIEFSKMAEHVASNREARNLGEKVMSVADVAYLWRFSRATAQFMDDVPKLATFVSRLEKGYTPAAAAEVAERYFYNFNNMSKVQSVVAKAIPFSSFPMKTAEAVYETVRTGHLASLTIPGKVQAALDGAFVQDNETRGAMDMMLPGYKHVLHPVHGELMPGMRELQVDIPWTFGTMDTIFHPEKASHPIAQLLMLAGSYNANDEEAWAEGENSRKQLMASNLDLVFPSYAREMLTLAEINGAIDMGGYFKNRYMTQMPTRSQFERGMDGGRKDILDKSTVFHKFQNAADFGQAMDQKYGENWLYNLVFRNRVDADEDEVAMQEAGIRGEFIRRRMRQFTLGLVSINKLDSNFFMNTFAIKRQIDLKQRQLKAEIVREGALMDTERISEPEFLKRMENERPLAKELLALQYKKAALMEYYEFFLEADKRSPTVSLTDILFGTREFEFDYGDKPEKDVYEKLYKRQTKKALPDDEADEKIDEIYRKESF